MTAVLASADRYQHENGRSEAFAHAYWLAHCEGFRVDGPGGRIGLVEAVCRDEHDEPLLAVRTGLLGRRVLLIPATEVFEIVPRAMRIWLRTPGSSTGSEPLYPAELDPGRARRIARGRRLSPPRAA